MSDDKTETDPALPKPDKVVKEDEVVKVIGEVGRWQLEKILIVFIAAAPGKSALPAHCFMSILQDLLTSSTLGSSRPSRSSGARRPRRPRPGPWSTTTRMSPSTRETWRRKRTKNIWATACRAAQTTSSTTTSGCPPWSLSGTSFARGAGWKRWPSSSSSQVIKV